MARPHPDPPGPGQEFVWDYPRAPRLEQVDVLVDVDLVTRQRVAERAAWHYPEPPPAYAAVQREDPAAWAGEPGMAFTGGG